MIMYKIMHNMQLKFDSDQVETINLRRFNAIIDEEVQITNKNLTSFDIFNIKYTIEHIRRTQINNTLRNDFDKHNERCNKVLDKLKIENEKIMKEQQETKSKDINNNLALIHKNNYPNSTTKAINNNNDKHNENVNHTSGDKIQMLLQDQKDLASKELEYQQLQKNSLVSELSTLTDALKESTLLMNKSINVQNMQLSEIKVYAAENKESLDEQKKKINQQTTTMTTSIWNTLGIMLFVLILFSITYLIIRILPKPYSNLLTRRTCINKNIINTEIYQSKLLNNHHMFNNINKNYLNTEVNIESQQYNNDINIESQQCNNDINLESQQLNNDINLESQQLNNDINIESQQYNNDINIESQQYNNDINIESQQYNNDINIESQQYNNDINIEFQQYNNDINIETQQYNNDINIETQQYNNEFNIESQQYNNDINIEFQQYNNDINIESQQSNDHIYIEFQQYNNAINIEYQQSDDEFNIESQQYNEDKCKESQCLNIEETHI